MPKHTFKADEPGILYFVTTTTVEWIDLFTRIAYKEILIASLKHCIAEKGLEIYAWVIMTNHIHFVGRSTGKILLRDIMRDFKKFTAKKLVNEIQEGKESRRAWLLDKFHFQVVRSGRGENYSVWQESYHAVKLETPREIQTRINYIHQNPVRAGFVEEAHHFAYSSATDYVGGVGKLPIVVMPM